MKAKIISREIVSEDGEDTSTHWFVATGYKWLNLNEALDEDVWDATFLDDQESLLQVSYTNGDGHELMSILNTTGDVLIKGVFSAEVVIPEFALMIVYFRDDQVISDQLMNPYMPSEDCFYAILDFQGRIKRAPSKLGITYCSDEKSFEIETRDGSKSISASMLSEKVTDAVWEL